MVRRPATAQLWGHHAKACATVERADAPEWRAVGRLTAGGDRSIRRLSPSPLPLVDVLTIAGLTDIAAIEPIPSGGRRKGSGCVAVGADPSWCVDEPTERWMWRADAVLVRCGVGRSWSNVVCGPITAEATPKPIAWYCATRPSGLDGQTRRTGGRTRQPIRAGNWRQRRRNCKHCGRVERRPRGSHRAALDATSRFAV